MENTKYIVREYSPESCDLSFYFDDDGLIERGGDFCYNLFIIGDERRVGSFNMKEYKAVMDCARSILDGF